MWPIVWWNKQCSLYAHETSFPALTVNCQHRCRVEWTAVQPDLTSEGQQRSIGGWIFVFDVKCSWHQNILLDITYFWEKSKEVRHLVIKPLARCKIQPSWLMWGICIATVDIRLQKNYSLVRMNRSGNPDFLYERKIIKPWLWGRGAQTTRNNSWRLCRYCDTSFEVVFLAHSCTACPLCEPLTLGNRKSRSMKPLSHLWQVCVAITLGARGWRGAAFMYFFRDNLPDRRPTPHHHDDHHHHRERHVPGWSGTGLWSIPRCWTVLSLRSDTRHPSASDVRAADQQQKYWVDGQSHLLDMSVCSYVVNRQERWSIFFWIQLCCYCCLFYFRSSTV